MRAIKKSVATKEKDAVTEMVEMYAAYRVRGYPAHYAAKLMKIDDEQINSFVDQMEISDIFHRIFAEKLEEARLDEMWNKKKAVISILGIVKSPYVSPKEKIAAIKELNEIMKVKDEKENEDKPLTLEEFYSELMTNV